MNKQLISLLVILLAVAGAVYYLTLQANKQTDTQALLFPQLKQQAQQIDRIEISNASGVLLDAKPSTSGWVTQLQGTGTDYPLQQTRLSQLIDSLANARLFEAKTSRSENFKLLGVSSIDQADSLATRVVIRAGNSSFDLLVGSQASSGQGSYVRLTNKSQSWLLDETVSVPTDSNDWLKQPILDIDASQIASISRVGEAEFTVVKNPQSDSQFRLLDVPEQQSLKYDSVIDNFVQSILSTNFESISGSGDLFEQQQSDLIRFEISLTSGEIIEMALLQGEQQSYLRFENLQTSSQVYWDGVVYEISSFAATQISKVTSDFYQSPQPMQSQPAAPAVDEGESPSPE